MQPVRLSEVDPETLKRIKQRASGEFGKVSEQARAIMQEVRQRGDSALRDFTARFDGVQLETLEVTKEEIEEGLREASSELIEAFTFAIANIRKFHRTHVKAEEEHVETVPGVEVWRVWRS